MEHTGIKARHVDQRDGRPGGVMSEANEVLDRNTFVPVAKVKDVKPGQIKTVRARGGFEIALTSVNGRIYAFDAYCPHQRWPLKWGAIDSDTLICGLHGWCFDLATGDALDPPLADCLPTYAVRVEGDVIHVKLYER